MSLTIISIGKKHDQHIGALIDRYEKRLRKPFDITWQLLPHSAKEQNAAVKDESDRIMERLTTQDFIVLLDELGESLGSPGLTSMIEKVHTQGRPIIFIIGGAYGVNLELRQRADLVWSLSALVFPHQIVRLVLTEQLYRAQTISRGEPYHHA